MCGAGRSPRGVCRLAGPALENQQQEDGTTTWENHVEARIGPREVTFEPRVYGSDVRYAKRGGQADAVGCEGGTAQGVRWLSGVGWRAARVM